MRSGPQKQLSLLLPLELHDRLKAMAEENGRSLSGCVRQILKRYVRHAEAEGEKGWWTAGR